jgi:hypothetical protein
MDCEANELHLERFAVASRPTGSMERHSATVYAVAVSDVLGL